MAAKKKNKAQTREQFEKVWANLDADKWLAIANDRKRDFEFSSRGSSVIGKCINPDHAETHPSFTINIEKHSAKCWGCNFYSRNPIELVALLLGVPESEAIQYLLEHYDFKFLSARLTAELEQQRQNQLVKQSIYAAAHFAMCAAIADPSDTKYGFAKDALDWLVNSRKIPQGAMHALPLGILPPMGMLGDIITDDYKKRHQAWSKNPGTSSEPKNLADAATDYMSVSYNNPLYNGSVLWPLHVSPNEIGRLKMRLPHDRSPKDYKIPDDEFEDLLGLYGLGWDMYQPLFSPSVQVNYAYIVEGEMDAMSLMARFVEQGGAKYPVLSVGGRGGAAHIEPILLASGIDKVFIIGDAPHKNGDEIVRGWLERIRKLETRVFIGHNKFMTPGLPLAGDLDEAVVQLGEDKVTEVIYNKTNENFTSAWKWAVEQASIEIDALPTDDVRSLITKAAEHGLYLKNRIESEYYITAISEKYGVNPHLLKREISATEPTEDGFIMNCAEALRDIFYVVGTDIIGGAGHRSLVCFSKKERSFHQFKLDNEQSIAQELAVITGGVYPLVKDYVGFPVFMETPENTEGMIRQKLDRQLRSFVRLAFDQLAQGAPSFSSSPMVKQGYHRLRAPQSDVLEPVYNEYIVCGMDVFLISRENNNTKFHRLEGPSHESTIFDVGMTGTVAPTWFPGGLKLDILERSKDIDVHQLYRDLLTFFNTGFAFKHQDTTSQFLAAFLLSLPIMDAFDHPSCVFITGDSHSGKSTLTQVFGSGDRNPIRLLYHSRYSQDYTPASIAGECDRSSLTMTLDESESSGIRAENMEAVFVTLRPIINGESRRSRSNSAGNRIEKILRMPVIMNAIVGARNVQDFNRMIIVEMKHVDGKAEPQQAIRRVLSDARIREMARQSTLAMLPRVPQVLESYNKIAANYEDFNKTLSFNVPSRYASMMFPVMAVMDCLGVDWKTFYRDYVVQNEAMITRANTVSESDTLLHAMMVTPAVVVSDRRGIKMSVGKLLADPDQWEEINTSNCGVYFDKQTKQLLFLLEQAIPQLLPPLHRYNMTSLKLKDTLERHRMAVTPEEISRSGILRRAIPIFGSGIKMQDVVVIHADSWLVASQTNEPAMEPVVVPQPKQDYNDFAAADEDFTHAIPKPPKSPSNAG